MPRNISFFPSTFLIISGKIGKSLGQCTLYSLPPSFLMKISCAWSAGSLWLCPFPGSQSSSQSPSVKQIFRVKKKNVRFPKNFFSASNPFTSGGIPINRRHDIERNANVDGIVFGHFTWLV